MFMLIKDRNCYRLHEVPKSCRACVSKITCTRRFAIMILDRQTIYFYAMRVKISLVPGDICFQNCLVCKCCKSTSDFFLATQTLDIYILWIFLFKPTEVNILTIFSMGLYNLDLYIWFSFIFRTIIVFAKKYKPSWWS